MKSRVLAAVVVVGCCWAARASAVPVLVDEEKGIAVNVGVLAQPWFQVTAPASSGQGSAGIGAPDGKSASFDFFLRRARIMVYGSVNKNLSFFIETDQPNLGKGGDFTSSMFIQDAFFTYQFAPELKIDAGMMLVPLSHHTIEGAIGIHTLDLHGEMIRLPAGKLFRDTGVELRGLLANNLLHYRVGVFEGVRQSAIPAVVTPAGMTPPPVLPALNDSGMPRFTGQLRLNVAGVESDFFLKGIYFSPTPIVSIGVGGDVQPKAVYKAGQPSTYSAFSVDVFAEAPLTAEDEFVGKANVYLYGEGASGVPGSNALAQGGTSLFAEAGFRHDWVEPLVFVEYLKAKNDSLTILAPHLGVNFWVLKHTFNLKLDVGYRKTDTTTTTAMVTTTTTKKDILATLQGQVFF